MCALHWKSAKVNQQCLIKSYLLIFVLKKKKLKIKVKI